MERNLLELIEWYGMSALNMEVDPKVWKLGEHWSSNNAISGSPAGFHLEF